MKVAIFGTGYVGLVTGTCLANVGNHVLCVDVDARKVERLNAGEVPIFEPGLDEMVAYNRGEGRLRFTCDTAEALAHGGLIFIAVGTPPEEDGSADLSHVLSVARTIGRQLERPAVVVNKSTVPVGTAVQVRATIQAELDARGADIDFDVASNPEFLKEGAAIEDFNRPDRIIVGAEREDTIATLRALYAPFNRFRDRLLVFDTRSAELAKYAANALLATKISFMNEVAGIAERLGADVEAVRHGIGSDPRIGWQFIYAGAGYGGSCFPKDVRALAAMGREGERTPQLLGAVEEVNNRQKRLLFEKIRAHYGGDLAGRRFALWGLAFKPGTDDMREAPSRVLMEALWEAGATVRAYDPAAMDMTRSLYGERSDLQLAAQANEVFEGADALVIQTEWHIFRSPDFELIRERLKAPVIFDGRNLYDPAWLARQGFTYYGIGRGTRTP
ncbi:MAG: UDP-glucose/GDP-mannose dehydrogenase family protein [Gammaproteobacteria bacterium]|nr:UDP-glucose/GDP-mannose dehydrogenase family protein [Gammaproteobacteria bacterium]